MRQITALVAAAVLAAGAASYAAPAHAQEMGSNPITDFFDGLGMGEKEKPDIDYQERAPLVPPTNTAALPSPQAKGAGRDATQWPNDPDVHARKERRARAEVAPTESYTRRMGDGSPRMDPDELGNRRVAGASVPRSAGGTTADNQVIRASPNELAGRPVAEAQTPGSRRLTDPPQQYMVGNGVTASPAPEKKSWLGKMFGN